MAVKARASITLNSVVDIKAICRYYLLQSSTLAKPSKPTTFPPSSTWSDTEPTYTSGSTNSLYYVDCTVFSDDAFGYSEVSLSTSYEAAKEAWNKAQNVQTNLDSMQENVDSELGNIRQTLTEQNTQIVENCESIILSALESCVKTGDYEEYKKTVEAHLAILADEISMNFYTAYEHITDVNGDLQTKFTELYKYISFSDEGITIGGNDNGLTLNLDDRGITFSKNGIPFGRWDGSDFYTGNIVVEVNERAQFGNFAFVPRSDGSLSFMRVSGHNYTAVLNEAVVGKMILGKG